MSTGSFLRVEGICMGRRAQCLLFPGYSLWQVTDSVSRSAGGTPPNLGSNTDKAKFSGESQKVIESFCPG